MNARTQNKTRRISDLVGVGLYTVREASRLSGADPRSIRRWLFGYSYTGNDKLRKESPPLWSGDLAEREFDHIKALSFLDLMEIRMVKAFRKHGVSWQKIRQAAEYACKEYDQHHPFTMRKFRTDGKRIFAHIFEKTKPKMLDLNRKSYVMENIVAPSLFEGIKFEHEQAARWFPEWGNKKIVVDPKRSFGRPILFNEGVPTDIIAKAVKVEDSVVEVAKWYDLNIASVRSAVLFEEKLAA